MVGFRAHEVGPAEEVGDPGRRPNAFDGHINLAAEGLCCGVLKLKIAPVDRIGWVGLRGQFIAAAEGGKAGAAILAVAEPVGSVAVVGLHIAKHVAKQGVDLVAAEGLLDHPDRLLLVPAAIDAGLVCAFVFHGLAVVAAAEPVGPRSKGDFGAFRQIVAANEAQARPPAGINHVADEVAGQERVAGLQLQVRGIPSVNSAHVEQ